MQYNVATTHVHQQHCIINISIITSSRFAHLHLLCSTGTGSARDFPCRLRSSERTWWSPDGRSMSLAPLPPASQPPSSSSRGKQSKFHFLVPSSPAGVAARRGSNDGKNEEVRTRAALKHSAAWNKQLAAPASAATAAAAAYWSSAAPV